MDQLSLILRILLGNFRRLILDNALVRYSLRGLLRLLLWFKLNPGTSQIWRHSEKIDRVETLQSVNPAVTKPCDHVQAYPDIGRGEAVRPDYPPYIYGNMALTPYSNQPQCYISASSVAPQALAVALEGYSARSFSRTSLPGPTADLAIPDRPTSDSPEDVLNPEGDVLSLKTTPTFSHPRIRPFAPDTIGRYDRNVRVPRDWTEYKIPPLTTCFDTPVNLPGWTSFTHPEGALYFYHESHKVFTDANLYEEDMLRQIHSDLDTIEDFFRAHNIQRSPDVDLVLELLRRRDGSIDTFYYLADHSRRSIYFIDEFEASKFNICNEVRGVISPTHLKHEIESQYWYHCLMFPKALKLTHSHVDELRDILMHSMGDQMLSPTSTAPYHVDDLQKMLSLVNNLRKNIDTDFQGSTCLMGGLMHVFVQQRFYDFHGQPSARMGRDQSVHGKVGNKRSWLILSLSPLLFYAPEVHLRALERMWVDSIMRGIVWTQFMSKLYTEWQEFTLYGTVLLNANVAFLAIQSVDVNRAGYRSPAQIASYASIISSIGSIILGLLLVRQNRSKARDTAFDAATFLHRRSNQALGLETLAIMFGLPYALLMWGMVSFLAAFLFMCFEGSDICTRLLVGSTWVAIAIVIVWCVWMAWEKQSQDNEDEEPDIRDDSKECNDGNGERKAFVAAWRWPTLLFRRSSCDSDTTAV